MSRAVQPNLFGGDDYVISCDGPGCAQTATDRDEERASKYALSLGWALTRRLDRCPGCRAERVDDRP